MPGFGSATFVQAAGFLKVADGVEPLDNTFIHPESYEVARELLLRLPRYTAAAGSEKVADRVRDWRMLTSRTGELR